MYTNRLITPSITIALDISQRETIKYGFKLQKPFTLKTFKVMETKKFVFQFNTYLKPAIDILIQR